MSLVSFLVGDPAGDSSSERLQKHKNFLRKERRRPRDGLIFEKFGRAHFTSVRGSSEGKLYVWLLARSLTTPTLVDSRVYALYDLQQS